MQDNGKELVRLFAETVTVREPIYEFGSLQVDGQVGYADLRPYFPGRTYVGTDMRAGPGVDCVLDLHAVDLPDASVGTALLLGTLEHVEFPWRAIAEMHRVLASDGALVLASHMAFPIHGHPHDFWRFTPEGFRSLLRAFRVVLVESSGAELSPHSVVAIAFKGEVDPALVERIRERLVRWKGVKPHSGWKHALLPWIPPAIHRLYRRARGRE